VIKELAIAYCTNGEKEIFNICQKNKKVINTRFDKVLLDYKFKISKYSFQLKL